MTAYIKILPIIFILLSIFLIPEVGYPAEPKKHMYFIGGGGEPKGDSTIFDTDIKLISRFTNSAENWETTVSFNGGHGKTEAIIASKMSKSRNAGPFVEKNYNALIAEMIQKIESGELAAGDQLLLTLNTHGAKRYKEKTHQVALSYGEAKDLTSLQGAQTVDLDGLEKLINLAVKKNVKLAIVDMSCFSGNTLNIKNDKVCMISATGTDHYGYAGSVDLGLFKMTNTFSGKFFSELKEGKNLEDIFLNARTKGDSPDFPMISTQNGLAINDLLYKMITPYLHYNHRRITDYHESYSNLPSKFEGEVCSLEQNHALLLNTLKQYEDMFKISGQASLGEFSALRSALEEYRSYQKKYEASLRGKLEAGQEVLEILKRDYAADKKVWMPYSASTFMSLDVDASLKQMEALYAKETVAYLKKYWKENIDSLKRQKVIVEEVKNKMSQASKDKIAESERVFSTSGNTYGLASKVSLEAKKVYDTLYRSMRKKSENNPCKDFVL